MGEPDLEDEPSRLGSWSAEASDLDSIKKSPLASLAFGFLIWSMAWPQIG